MFPVKLLSTVKQKAFEAVQISEHITQVLRVSL